MGEPAISLSAGCDEFGTAVCGALCECALSWLRHPGGVGGLAGWPEAAVATALVALAAPLARGRAARDESDRHGRPRAVCAVAVQTDSPSGLASERAARLWLAVAVATLWLVSVGGEAEAEIAESTIPELVSVKTRRSGTRWRATGIFRRGAVLILVGLLNHQLLPVGRFLPEDWPTSAPITQLSTGKGRGMRGGP